MSPTATTTYRTPDGKERPVRFTLGARRRIADMFGGLPIPLILEKYDTGAAPDLLYACMYDEQGKPPADLTLEAFRESLDPDAGPDAIAAFLEAVTKGAVEKKAMAAAIRGEQAATAQKLIGLVSGLSAASTSDSPTPSSGTAQSGNSTPSVTDTTSASSAKTTEPA